MSSSSDPQFPMKIVPAMHSTQTHAHCIHETMDSPLPLKLMVHPPFPTLQFTIPVTPVSLPCTGPSPLAPCLDFRLQVFHWAHHIRITNHSRQHSMMTSSPMSPLKATRAVAFEHETLTLQGPPECKTSHTTSVLLV